MAADMAPRFQAVRDDITPKMEGEIPQYRD
jgi:hypothetical protein